ncbi:MAG: methyltransferase domain-containing protein [Alphaproteobacteria bacterium]|nr:methyltransferase domain-containing protein [Alphaproteobacteria bacterium]
MFPSKPNPSRLLLAKIRGGDYAHAGDKDAFRVVLPKIVDYFKERLVEQTVLDVGCGLGGTADYLYTQGFYNIWGIDIDKGAIEYARSKYPFIDFSVWDATQVDQKFEKDFFSLLYLFNVFYALSDQQKMQTLNSLAAVAKPGALLVIFECTSPKAEDPQEIKDLTGKPMRPIVLPVFHDMIKKSKWEIIEKVDLSDQYIKWYKDLLYKLDQQKNSFTNEFPVEIINHLTTTYIAILEKLEKKTWGGIVVYAKRKPD